MFQIVVIEEGGVKCSSACPYYEESGVVRCQGGPKRSHCRAIMEDIVINCDKFNPKQMWKGKTVLTAKEIGKLLGVKLQKQRKLYPAEHKEIHHIGENTRAGMPASNAGGIDGEPALDAGTINKVSAR